MLLRAIYYVVVLAFCWVGLAPVGARAQVLAGTFAEGFGHSLSILADGTRWAVGNNKYGQPGTSRGPVQLRPAQVGTNTNRGPVVAWAT
jgi:hypothetical protein